MKEIVEENVNVIESENDNKVTKFSSTALNWNRSIRVRPFILTYMGTTLC